MGKILYVYDEEIYADGMEQVIASLPNKFNFIKIYCGDDVQENIEKNNYDLVFLTKLKEEDNISFYCNLLKTLHPSTKIIVVGRKISQDEFKHLMDMGIDGFIFQNYNKEKIKSVVSLILMDEKYYPKELTKKPEKSILTAQQINVVKQIRKGYSNKQIAYELNISESTVKVHISAIMKKLNCYNRLQIVKLATEIGLLD